MLHYHLIISVLSLTLVWGAPLIKSTRQDASAIPQYVLDYGECIFRFRYEEDG